MVYLKVSLDQAGPITCHWLTAVKPAIAWLEVTKDDCALIRQAARTNFLLRVLNNNSCSLYFNCLRTKRDKILNYFVVFHFYIFPTHLIAAVIAINN